MADWARPVVVFEIRGRDTAKLREFYRELFNWKIDDSNPVVTQIAAGIGGPEPGPVGVLVPGAPGVTVYVQVLDLRSSLDKAKALGGSVVVEPFIVPGRELTIARIADPEGTQIGLVQQ
ncbi:MAG: VOC family protein [Dehalococcoidia bacterium]